MRRDAKRADLLLSCAGLIVGGFSWRMAEGTFLLHKAQLWRKLSRVKKNNTSWDSAHKQIY